MDGQDKQISTIKDKLLQIQTELKAPKNQWNKFGKYYYRNCEDILEALKPLLSKYNALLTISDSIEFIGDRFYLKAMVTLSNLDPIEEGVIGADIKDYVTVTALAREPLNRSGMDDSQITGACSSYARKYALNAMFLIDDVKDADASKPTEVVESNNKDLLITPSQISIIKSSLNLERMTNMLAFYGVENIEQLTLQQASETIKKIKKEQKQ